jgi:hypothetical protein
VFVQEVKNITKISFLSNHFRFDFISLNFAQKSVWHTTLRTFHGFTFWSHLRFRHSLCFLSITLFNEDEYSCNEATWWIWSGNRITRVTSTFMLREIVAISHYHVSFVPHIHLNILRHCSLPSYHEQKSYVFVNVPSFFSSLCHL